MLKSVTNVRQPFATTHFPVDGLVPPVSVLATFGDVLKEWWLAAPSHVLERKQKVLLQRKVLVFKQQNSSTVLRPFNCHFRCSCKQEASLVSEIQNI